jgi:hypothetical protein
LRTILESVAVGFGFALRLIWRHHNRTALELGQL